MSDSESENSTVNEKNDDDLVRLKESDLNFKDAPVLLTSDFVLFAHYAASNNKVLRERAFKNLYCFVSCLAMEDRSLECPKTNLRNLWMLAYENFGDVIQHYVLKEASKRTLESFPQQVWPQGFVEFCAVKNMNSAKPVPKKWIQRQKNEIANVQPDTYKHLYAGYKIVAVVKRAKRIINNELNPLYREDKVPSGLNSLHLLYAIRLVFHCLIMCCMYIVHKSAYLINYFYIL